MFPTICIERLTKQKKCVTVLLVWRIWRS